MTNRKRFFYGALLAQLVEHQTFNLRAMGSSPISGSSRILFVSTLYGNNFFLFMPVENVLRHINAWLPTRARDFVICARVTSLHAGLYH